uniref:Uncharacterized protein n=2 Tax=viral metagenome TaxID=1070528 RepID=A0A6H2A5X7_9ZZZZ
MNQINITKIKEEYLNLFPCSHHPAQCSGKCRRFALNFLESSILKILDKIDVEFRGESPTGYNQAKKEIKDIITKLKT